MAITASGLASRLIGGSNRNALNPGSSVRMGSLGVPRTSSSLASGLVGSNPSLATQNMPAASDVTAYLPPVEDNKAASTVSGGSASDVWQNYQKALTEHQSDPTSWEKMQAYFNATDAYKNYQQANPVYNPDLEALKSKNLAFMSTPQYQQGYYAGMPQKNEYGYYASEPPNNSPISMNMGMGTVQTTPYVNTQFGWVPVSDYLSNASSQFMGGGSPSRFAALQDMVEQQEAANNESSFSKIYKTVLPMATRAILSYGVGSVLSEGANLAANAAGMAGASGDSGTLFGFNDIIPQTAQSVGQAGANIAMSKNPEEALIQAGITQGLNIGGDYLGAGDTLADAYGYINQSNKVNQIINALGAGNQYPVSEKFSQMGVAYDKAKTSALQEYLTRALLNAGYTGESGVNTAVPAVIQQAVASNYDPNAVSSSELSSISSGASLPAILASILATKEKSFGGNVSRNRRNYLMNMMAQRMAGVA